MPALANLRAELKAKASPKKAKLLQRYFKTGKGEYGEGDVFLGVMVPETRKIIRKYKDLKLKDIQKLLKSRFHEERLAALLILVEQFNNATAYYNAIVKRGALLQQSTPNRTLLKRSAVLKFGAMTCHNTSLKQSKHGLMTCHKDRSWEKIQEIFNFYLKNTKYINNWDLVDLSAPKIIGEYLLQCEKCERMRMPRILQNKTFVDSHAIRILASLASAQNIWERRIAVLATFAFIRESRFKEALKIAEMLLDDKHDLIHKAVGWMLREIGKKSQKILEAFLKKHHKQMPRVMLRYAIERFPAGKRKYLKNKRQN